MIERLIEASIRNRFLVLMITAALTVAGVYAVFQTPVDAIPDLSENQVIVFTDWMGRSPREIEDQVTYPLSRKLQGLAGVRAVRSSSEFNFSMITIIFEDGVDFYFARQRVTEKLAQSNTFLPAGVVPYLAPDATALGQIFWYTVEPSPENPLDPAKLWALNKFYIAPQLNAAPGVSDVAIVGGMPLEYQIDVRPESLRAYGITLGELYAAVGKSNLPAGGGVVQKNNAEYIVRGVGWITGKQDIENTVIKEVRGTPIFVKTVANVQLGTQFRRSVFEKDGNEVTGGAVLMRHGGNPLEVTQRVKDKIQELQPGLPEGVHIVAAYDRTRLIHGAIHTLTEVMWHEMVIASIAILLILTHLRSVFVICVTLPLAVLFSFLLMFVLRKLGIVDIQANIMSLAGITISIGILVDQAIVMTENATHHLKDHFGDRPVTGDTREIVIPACRTVGRPIFFSVLIMLLSFVPVFMLSGREGKYFHPLAFTKSFALIGVAIISVTVVPALIPIFIKGRLRSEEENAIVRSFIHIYKPFLTWALPRRNLVMWAFAALLVIAAGIFPLQALFGMGAAEQAWRICYFATFALVTFLTVMFTRGIPWQMVSFATLTWLGLWAYHLPKIGVSFMPALDEGTTLDMPITVPRASVTQSADDLKARDALLRGFPEVESVIGKAGRADTPTDPAPLDMVETFVNFRPREQWPKRVLKYPDAADQTHAVLAALVDRGYVAKTKSNEDRDSLVNDAAQKSLERLDEVLRELASLRYAEFGRELEQTLTRFAVADVMRRLREAGQIVESDNPHDQSSPEGAKSSATHSGTSPRTTTTTTTESRPVGASENGHPPLSQGFALGYRISPLRGLETLTARHGRWLARQPALEDIDKLCQELVESLNEVGSMLDPATALELRQTPWGTVTTNISEFFGGERKSFAGEVLLAVEAERMRLWRERVKQINWELADHGTSAFVWFAIEEVVRAAKGQSLLEGASHAADSEQFLEATLKGQRGGGAKYSVLSTQEPVSDPRSTIHDPQSTIHNPPSSILESFASLRDALLPAFRDRVFLWQRQTGPKGDLVDDEMGRVLQVPGWSNIFTQPIINRIEMLSTGVRTDIGVKVFGADLETINGVCKEIEAALKPVSGARDVVASPIMGKGYLQIEIDRERAARYGISIEAIQNEIEVALGGRTVTYTVEKRERFPVRIRYARADREDEDAIRRLLVSANGMSSASADGGGGMSSTGGTKSGSAGSRGNPTAGNLADKSAPTSVKPSLNASHTATPAHASGGARLIPLGSVAEVRIVEGPAMIRSENGRLLNYVTLNVRGRDIVGFVDEAQRKVAQKVRLPEGVHLEWSGEFEHQVRAARTLRFVFPAVIVLIFVILYLTYHDLADAALMMLAVPEALAGGAFFMFLFPKIMQGWDAPPMDFSVAVWVGFIACFGMATETGIIMLVYLREAIEKHGGLENMTSLEQLRQAVIEGAVHRLRPKLLTEGVAIIAIFPMVFARGVGGEILAPMALPVLGGLLISDEVVDLFLPVRFYWVRRARWLKLQEAKRAQAKIAE
jgi:Cu(I)/Ag(I) efflux system membrane protein CusA/SilA